MKTLSFQNNQCTLGEQERSWRLRSCQRGWSQIEVVASTLLISFVMVAALESYRFSLHSNANINERYAATQLAQTLLAEILSKQFEEAPNTLLLGRDAGESSTNRQTWNDVDDYHNYSDQVPAFGITDPAITTRWTRTVTVDHVAIDDQRVSSSTRTGLKRVIVRVISNSKELVKIEAHIGEALEQSLAGSLRWGPNRDDDRNQAPRVIASVDPRVGNSPLVTQFCLKESFDLEGDSITYRWFLNGQPIQSSTAGTVTLVNRENAFRVAEFEVEARDAHGNSARDIARVVLLPNPAAADGSDAQEN